MDFWRQHLQDTLAQQGLLAYVWNVDSGHIEWQGDAHAVLGQSAENLPVNQDGFMQLLHPDDAGLRLSAIEKMGDGAASSMAVRFRLARTHGADEQIDENITLHTDPQTGARVLRGVLRVVPTVSPLVENTPTQKFSMVSYDTSMTHYGRILICNKIFEWSENYAVRMGNVGYLLAIGVDRLSMWNEAFGAQFTDAIIHGVGQRLNQLVGETAVVARIDGDVFGVFFTSAPHSEMAAVAHHILHSFYEFPLQTERGPMGISVSAGGVCISRQCKDPARMLTRAEMAMQTAKERGRGRFVSYVEAKDEAQNTRAILESGDSFIRALKENRVKLAFQPVVSSRSSNVSFHECLIRFSDEEGKLHSAGEFMPAVERLGLCRLVDRYAMNLALQELMAFADLSLSVNVSNLTLTDPDWLRGIVATLRDRPDVAKRLIVEITETVAMQDLERTFRIVQTLHDLGCRVALDDFGAGYTAFSELRRLNVDIVKIDKSFIRDIDERENRLFVKTLNTLAQGVEMETVGEGAETMTEAKMLAGDGVDHIQGYVFGFPSVERVWLPRDHSLRRVTNRENDGRMDGSMTAEQIMNLMRSN